MFRIQRHQWNSGLEGIPALIILQALTQLVILPSHLKRLGLSIVYSPVFSVFRNFYGRETGRQKWRLVFTSFHGTDKLLLHRDQCRPSAGSQSFSFGPYSSTIHWQKSFHRLVHSAVTLFSSSGAIQLCSRLHFASCFQPSKVIDSEPIMTCRNRVIRTIWLN